MNLKTFKAGWLLSGLTAAAMFASCSQESVEPVQEIEAPGTVRFTLALPGGEDVVYPTRAIHTQEEWEIKNLLIMDFALDDAGEWVCKKLLKPTNLTPVGNGEYSLSFSEDSEEIGKQHKFVFLGNSDNYIFPADTDLADLSNQVVGLDIQQVVAEQGCFVVSSEDSYNGYKFNGNASWFTEHGIVMSGMATDAKGSQQTEVTITNGTVSCHVDMLRAVGRVDLYSNAPNLLITGATMRNAANVSYAGPKEYYLDQYVDLFDGSNVNTIAFNSNYTEALAQGNPQAYTPETFAEKQTAQSYPDNGVKKAFYMLPQHNQEGNCLEVEVEYMLRDGSKGTVTVPFIKEDKTTGEKTYVDAERNHLYKIVLGNGEEVENGSDVTAEIIDEPWNVVDLPAVIPGAGGDDEGEDVGIYDYNYDSTEFQFKIFDSKIPGKKDVLLVYGTRSESSPTDEEVKDAIKDLNIGIFKFDTYGHSDIADLSMFVGYDELNVTVLDVSALVNNTKPNQLPLMYLNGLRRLVLPNSFTEFDCDLRGKDPNCMLEVNIPEKLAGIVLAEDTKLNTKLDVTHDVILDLSNIYSAALIECDDSGNNLYWVIKNVGKIENMSLMIDKFFTCDKGITVYVPDEEVSMYQDISNVYADKVKGLSEYESDKASFNNPIIYKVWEDPKEFAVSPLWSPN